MVQQHVPIQQSQHNAYTYVSDILLNELFLSTVYINFHSFYIYNSDIIIADANLAQIYSNALQEKKFEMQNSIECISSNIIN